MDPLSETQLRILREAATPEGCREYRAPSARRLLGLRFVEERDGVLRATDRGREHLAKMCTPSENGR